MCRMVSVVHITSFLHNRKDQLFESKLSKKLTSPALGSSNTASTDYAIEFNLQIKLTVGRTFTHLFVMEYREYKNSSIQGCIMLF